MIKQLWSTRVLNTKCPNTPQWTMLLETDLFINLQIKQNMLIFIRNVPANFEKKCCLPHFIRRNKKEY